jgi:hypothetical protein
MLTTPRLESLRAVISSLESHRDCCTMSPNSSRLLSKLLISLSDDLVEAESDAEDVECARLLSEIERLSVVVRGGRS